MECTTVGWRSDVDDEGWTGLGQMERVTGRKKQGIRYASTESQGCQFRSCERVRKTREGRGGFTGGEIAENEKVFERKAVVVIVTSI